MTAPIPNQAVSARDREQLTQLTLPGDYVVRVHEYSYLELGPFAVALPYYQATICFVPSSAGFRERDVVRIDTKFPANLKDSKGRAHKSAQAMIKALRELRARTGERYEVAFKIKEREAGRKNPRNEQLVAAIKDAVR